MASFSLFPRSGNLFRVLGLIAMAVLLQACGSDGSDGADAVDTGSIKATVTSGGSPVEGATVSTAPASSNATTNASGEATLSGVPIGFYDVTASVGGIEDTASVGVAAGTTVNVSLSLSGVPGTIEGTVLGPNPDMNQPPLPVEGATVSTPDGVSTVTDANGEFTLDGVTRSFLTVDPPAGTTLLPGGPRHSVSPGDVVEIMLSGGPSATATYVDPDAAVGCPGCHEVGLGHEGLVDAWQGSGHFRVVERSLIEMDTTGWPADPGTDVCSAWMDTGVDANDPSEPTSSDPSHSVFIQTCDTAGVLSFHILVDGNDDGADMGDTTVEVYSTYGGVGTAAGELTVLKDRGDPQVTDLHGAWKQRYMFNIARTVSEGGPCPDNSPEGHPKPDKPAFVGWDTDQTCEDMLISPIQYNQRTDEWVSYHTNNWYAQGRTYSKKCSGCHEAGITLTADGSNVTQYAAADYRIGCQKCHGPGSEHIAGVGDKSKIINPEYLTPKAAREVCGQCHSRGSDPDGVFGFPWRSDVAEFDGNFVPGIHTLDFDAENPDGYYTQKPGLWPDGHSVKHHQQYNDFLKSTHKDNPFEILTCHDCHSPHSGHGGPFMFENEDSAGSSFVFADNARALMSNVRCLSCHATHGPFEDLTLDDVAVYHTARGGSVEKDGVALAPSPGEQGDAEAAVEEVVNQHQNTVAGMPLVTPYQPEESNIPANFLFGQGPVGRCTSCHMTKTSKSATWFDTDADPSLRIQGDTSNHIFDIVAIHPNTDQPNTCGRCHDNFRTAFEPAGGD